MNKKINLDSKICNIIFACLVFAYAFRHVNYGLDIMDTGYNIGNYKYMGLAHIDEPWFFATLLSNTIGHIICLLPGGDKLLGFNIYSTSFIAAMAVAIGVFLKRELKICGVLVWLGEFLALSLYWLPPAVLYDSLTFLFKNIAIILIYIGLIHQKHLYILISGVFLGFNILNRVSNLSEIVLIFAIVGYGILQWYETIYSEKKYKKRALIKEVLLNICWFLVGYGLAVLLWASVIHIRYGIGSYINGIRDMLGITDKAAEYGVDFAIKHICSELLQYTLRLWRLLLGGFLGFVAVFISKRIGEKTRNKKVLWGGYVFCIIDSVYILYHYLSNSNYFSNIPNSYSYIYAPVYMLTIVILVIAFTDLFRVDISVENKLFGGLIISAYFLSVVGGNNYEMMGMCNMFFIIPYGFNKLYNAYKSKFTLPFALTVSCFIFYTILHISNFGFLFLYKESATPSQCTEIVNNNEILSNIKMTKEKAAAIEEISEFVNENGLKGQEAMFYYFIPSLTYYLQMPPIYTSWPELNSKSSKELNERLCIYSSQEEYPPVFIGRGCDFSSDDEKTRIIYEWINTNGYILAFQNEICDVYLPETN